MENEQSKPSIKSSSSGTEKDQGIQDIHSWVIPKGTDSVIVTCEPKIVSIYFLNQRKEILMRSMLHLVSLTMSHVFYGNFPGVISMPFTNSIELIGEIIQLNMSRENGSSSEEENSG